ncbi:odorant receptor 67c-like [Phlebotomus argentipes]|uniref:odorant receptor 67c-like n=1 Tax=Phlebotomus argentipes TaxID=94469 RepID=UPI002893630D|nr:odorant receptor 67c-like [Phlebotomus argentipes]
MLEVYQSGLKDFLNFFFLAWRLDFLPKSKWSLLNFIRLSIYPSYTAFGVGCEVWHLIGQMEDYSDLIHVAFATTIAIGFSQTLMIYALINVHNKDRIIAIFDYFEQLLASKDNLISEIRTKFYEKNMKIAHYCARYFLSGTFICWIGIVSFCMYLSGYSSPMLFTIPGLPRENFFFYPVNIVYQASLFFIGFELLMSSDVIIMIIIVLFQSEQESIANLISSLENREIAKKQGDEILRKVFDIHLSLSEQAKEMTQSFWYIYIMKLLLIMMYLCSMFLTFQDISEVPIAGILSILVMTGETCILCYFGEMLKTSSDFMLESMYMTKWYEMNLKNQKTMLIMMTRFFLPMKVETFGFGTISLYTFVQSSSDSFTYSMTYCSLKMFIWHKIIHLLVLFSLAKKEISKCSQY